MDSPAETLGAKFRQRVSKACDHCRKRKIKCGAVNMATGACENCAKFQVECTFNHHNGLEQQRQRLLEEGANVDGSRGVGAGIKKAKKTHDQATVKNHKLHSPLPDLAMTESPTAPPEYLERRLLALENQIGTLIKLISRQSSAQSSSPSGLQGSPSSITHHQSLNIPALPDVSPRPKQRRYTSSLLTKRRIAWLRQRAYLCQGSRVNDTNNGMEPITFSPLMEVFVTSSKWYVAEVKKIIDFSTPFVPMHTAQLYPLPPQAEIRELSENFLSTIFTGGYAIISGQELIALFERYYAGDKLSYSELLLIDISLCISTAYDFKTSECYFLKEGSPELDSRESCMLLNSMYQYHKVALLSEGLKSVQALILLYQYVHTKVSANIAYNIFCVAQKFAQDIGLHRRETYQGLNFQEASQRLKIWIHCISIDAQLSLAFSRRPMINIDETEIFTEEFYADFIKTHDLSSPTFQPKSNFHPKSGLDRSMSILAASPNSLLVGASYYAMTLARISHKCYEYLFKEDAMVGTTFDEVLERILSLISDLREWERALPGEFSLDHYRDHIDQFNTQSNVHISEIDRGHLSTSVLYLHFEHALLLIIVSQMACSFIHDNEDINSQSRFNVGLIRANARQDIKQEGLKIITLYPRIKVVPYMLHRVFYIFCVGAYILLFSIIGFLEEETGESLMAIVEVYDYLLEAGDIKILKDSIKWNVSMFILTFLLTLAIKCFTNYNPNASKFNLNAAVVSDKFGFWMARCESNKTTAVNQLKEHLNVFAPCADLPADEPGVNGSSSTNAEGADSVLPRAFHLFSEVDTNDLNLLLSTLPIQVMPFDSSDLNDGLKNLDDDRAPMNIDQSAPSVGLNVIGPPGGSFGTDFSTFENSFLAPTQASDQNELEQILDNMVFERDFIFPAMM
ncbi:LADA_0B09384g1_1 [Lachancea dasiensis]|uniref:LADA_0B09384g1_1 n=1 Tax=Lachancea dasiensis TaxID=1072105 RepID=A0A1G4IUW0_9SACH|nr:LADA_0B09384g1_1 [Lachancea dasiensis]